MAQNILNYLTFYFTYSLVCFLNPINSYSNTQTREAKGYHYHIKEEAAKIKGMFVFGSSLVDNGNNNFLENLAKADYFPYGIDFPLGPSGRFTNGKNVIDLIGDHLNLPCYIPPFKNPNTRAQNITHGVNFASGASGILDETGSIAGNVMSMNEQIKNFEEVTLPDLEVQVGLRSTESLPNYIFVVGSGGNDYTLNYFPITSRISNVTLQEFTANLTASLSQQLQRLYRLGARKFVVMSLYPIGCSPNVVGNQTRENENGSRCIETLNTAANLFNTMLKSMIDDDVINLQMPGSTLVNVNAYNIIMDIINNPASQGFSDASNSCCEVGSIGGLCKREGSTCEDRTAHVYFDGIHPTEAVNVLLARKAYASHQQAEVYPFNIKKLVNISC